MMTIKRLKRMAEEFGWSVVESPSTLTLEFGYCRATFACRGRTQVASGECWSFLESRGEWNKTYYQAGVQGHRRDKLTTYHRVRNFLSGVSYGANFQKGGWAVGFNLVQYPGYEEATVRKLHTEDRHFFPAKTLEHGRTFRLFATGAMPMPVFLDWLRDTFNKDF